MDNLSKKNVTIELIKDTEVIEYKNGMTLSKSGAYIAWKVIKARRAEEKMEAKGLIMQLVVGILVVFVIVAGVPLLVQGLASWAGVELVPLG